MHNKINSNKMFKTNKLSCVLLTAGLILNEALQGANHEFLYI